MELLRIKELLKEKGISGKDLAERVGVSANSISQISTGQKFPRPELLLKISEELEVDIRDLFYSTKKENELNGYIEYKSQIHRIKSIEDIDNLKSLIGNE